MSLLLVIDTNVLVSAALKPSGACGELLRRIIALDCVIHVDERIRREYREVLSRPHFKLNAAAVDAFFAAIADRFLDVHAPTLEVELIDISDRPFVEVAIAKQADIVTGNRKHFPATLPVRVLSPAELLAELRELP